MSSDPDVEGGVTPRIIGWDEFGRLCAGFAAAIRDSYAPELVVGIAKGGVIVGAVLASHLRVDFFPIKLSRRVMAEVVQEEPIFQIKPYSYCEGKRVLLVDDFAHSGQTLRIAEKAIRLFRPEGIRTAAFYRDVKSFKPDFCALATDESVLFPWETDLLEPTESDTRGEGGSSDEL